MTDLRQAAQAALEALTIYSDAQCSLKGRNAITALRTALEQQAEPVAREGFERWAKSLPNYIDLSRFEDGYSDCNTDYAWAGWKSAQRQWQGLTDEDVNRESAPIAQQMKLAFHAGMYVAQQILKEKNGLHKD